MYSLLFINLLLSGSIADTTVTFRTVNVKIRCENRYERYWHELVFANADTAFSRWVYFNKKKAVADSIPEGKYSVRLWSDFNDYTEKTIDLHKSRHLTFDVRSIYESDKGKLPFISQMKSGDTLFIDHYEKKHIPYGCVLAGKQGFSIIIKEDSFYYLLSLGKSDSLRKYLLSNTQINKINKIEIAGKQHIDRPGEEGYNCYTHMVFCWNRRISHLIVYECYFGQLKEELMSFH